MVTLEFTQHALKRIAERRPPAYIVNAWLYKPFLIAAKDEGRPCFHNIVRDRSDVYWVAIVKEQCIITVMNVDSNRAREWFQRRLVSFKYDFQKILRLPPTCSPLEAQIEKTKNKTGALQNTAQINQLYR